jgi:ABC-type phosphate transport system ATPase subunit
VTPAVETVDLSCRYPGAAAPALDRIALALPPRTVTLVMGATGAGKSTLARCLARLVPCFTAADVTGDVRLGGASIAEKTSASSPASSAWSSRTSRRSSSRPT